MSDLNWASVRPGDYIEAGGNVYSVEKHPNGDVTFTIRGVALLTHDPVPPPVARPWHLYTATTTSMATKIYLFEAATA